MKDDMMYAYSIMTDENGNYTQKYSNEYGEVVVQFAGKTFVYNVFYLSDY